MIHLILHVGRLAAGCLLTAPVRNLEHDSEVHTDSQTGKTAHLGAP